MYTYSKSNAFSKNHTVKTWVINEPGYNEDEHIHDFLELVYTISGNVTHKIDGKIYEATPDSILFINPRQIHSITTQGEYEFVNIIIKQEFISEYAVDGDTFYSIFRFFLSDPKEKISQETQMVQFKGNDAYEIKKLVNFMLAETKKKEPGYAITLNGYARVIFTKLFRSLQKNNPDENYPKAFFLDMMQTLIDYIDTNYNEPITLSTLATKCYFNPSYISREFKKLSGKGFKEYITEKRISEAEKYLTQTDLSIEEIQVKIGFTNKTRFFKEFSKYYNCTPGEYRKKHQE